MRSAILTQALKSSAVKHEDELGSALRPRRSMADGRRPRAGGRRRSAGRQTRSATIFLPRCFPRSGGSTAASRSRKAISRVPLPFSDARSVTRSRPMTLKRSGSRTTSLGLLQAGRRYGDRPRAHREVRSSTACSGQPALPRAAALTLRCDAGSRRPHRGGHRRAASSRAPCRVGASAGCARHHLQQPGKRRPASASPRAGARPSEQSAAQQEQQRARSRSRALTRDARSDSVRLGQAAARGKGSSPRPRVADAQYPQFNEITGAVYDTLAQIAFIRGGYESADDYLSQAGEAYGSYGAQTGLWYEWSIRVLQAKLAARRGDTDEALRLANEIAAKRRPPKRLKLISIACEALLAGGRAAERRSASAASAARIDARAMPGAWGEFLRLRGTLHESAEHLSEAYHDIAQSASVFELITEAISRVEPPRARASREPRRRPIPSRAPVCAGRVDVRDTGRRSRISSKRRKPYRSCLRPKPPTRFRPSTPMTQSFRRLIDAAAFPELLGHEAAAAVRDTLDADCAVVFVAPPEGDLRLVAWTGADADRARAVAMRAAGRSHGTGWVVSEQTGQRYLWPSVSRNSVSRGRFPTRCAAACA